MRFTNIKIAAACAALLATSALVTPAFADPGNVGNGNGNCGVGNGNGGPVECHGGSGGGGGEGGGGGGGGGSADQSQQQQQQQQQHQLQGQLQGQHQSSENNNDNDNSNSNSINIDTHNERAPVNTAYAAPMVAGEDTCMGSSSVGGQGIGFGLSIGTTWTDNNCQRLKNSRQLASLGFTRAAVALVCVDEDVQGAMEAAGTPCPVTKQQKAEIERVRAEEREAAAERAEDSHRLAQNAYTPVAHDAPAPVVAPVVQAAPATPSYHFEPMKPIKD